MKNKILLLTFLLLATLSNAQVRKKPITKKVITISKTITKPTPIVKKGAYKPVVVDNSTPTVGVFANIETTKGVILLQLEYVKTPITVANFVSLAEGNNSAVKAELKGKPFYDGLKFHRVIADFMIQGGDPAGNGSGGPGYAFKDEFTGAKFDRAGILAMANSGPKTNGSQFFITHKATPWLSDNGDKHTIFGYVTSGQDVVNAIAQDDLIIKKSQQ